MDGTRGVKERKESMMTPGFWPWQLGRWGHSLMKRGDTQGGREKMGMGEMESNSLGQMHSTV